MDPLSVTMAIVGLLTASWKISVALQPILSSSKAPKEVQDIKSAVDTIRSVLTQLQLMLLGRAQVDRARTSLILVDQIVVTLSACVSTFSELDVFVESLGNDEKLGLMDRIRWAAKATPVKEHLTKLETHKSSLTLMMTILTCDSTYKAEDAVDQLSASIQSLLDSHKLIAERLASIEISVGIVPAAPPALALDEEPHAFQRNAAGFAFEEELESSWVYKRSIYRDIDGAFSITSSAGRTASWSMLSGLSLADNITSIAIQALPIYACDISNDELYQFGEFDEKLVLTQSLGSPSPQSSDKPRLARNLFRQRMNRISAKLSKNNLGTLSGSTSRNDQEKKAIFGIPLRQGIKYANVAITMLDDAGQSFIYGYVPIVVAKSGVYIKEKGKCTPRIYYQQVLTLCSGVTVENIFYHNGLATKILELQKIFDSPPRHGMGLDMTSYTVHDATGVLLRYLKLLPQPVIPFDMYDQFIDQLILIEEAVVIASSLAQAIEGIRQAVTLLPPLSRSLLLYLLDLLKTLAEDSPVNQKTLGQLVVVFQPSLLSRPLELMSSEDYISAAKVMVFIAEQQQHFMVIMRKPNSTAETAADTKPIAEQPISLLAKESTRSNSEHQSVNDKGSLDSNASGTIS